MQILFLQRNKKVGTGRGRRKFWNGKGGMVEREGKEGRIEERKGQEMENRLRYSAI